MNMPHAVVEAPQQEVRPSRRGLGVLQQLTRPLPIGEQTILLLIRDLPAVLQAMWQQVQVRSLLDTCYIEGCDYRPPFYFHRHLSPIFSFHKPRIGQDVMFDPEYAKPGRLVPPLALDACVPLYSLLHAPPDDGSLRRHAFLKQAVEYARFVPDQAALWAAVQSYAHATLSETDNKAFLGWIYNAFTGLHPPDVDLSGWLIALLHFHYSPNTWEDSGMSQENIEAANAMIDRYFAELDEDAFMAAVAQCQARPLTDWDKRMHQAYGFVYFDRARGADPFLKLKFVHQGETLRSIVRTTDFTDPAFPVEELRIKAQALIDKLDVWMPPGLALGPLSAVL
jgi:hypothetical protein